MRLVIDTLVALMLAGVLGGVIVAHRESTDHESLFETGQNSLRDLQRQIRLQAALKQVPLNEHGWPLTIDPEWFGDTRPDNPFLDDNRPWIEIATPIFFRLDHPLDLSTADPRAAEFWYNPAKGIIRARVPAAISDKEAVENYNRLNSVFLINSEY